MPRMNMIEAINDALDIMMGRDPDVVIMGEDVGYFGGVFRCTEGLQAKYGKSRVFDAPISEGGIVGTAVGMGAYGLRAVAWYQGETNADDPAGYEKLLGGLMASWALASEQVVWISPRATGFTIVCDRCVALGAWRGREHRRLQ